MKRKDIINLALFALIFGFALYRYVNKEIVVIRSEFLMDTIVEIKGTSAQNNVESIIDSTFKLMESYEKQYSYFDSTSNIYRFNHSESEYLKLDDDLLQMLNLSNELFYNSDSLYDVSIGPLSDLWNFSRKEIPADASIATALKQVGFDKLQIGNKKIFKPSKMKLNFGSLVKGFIVDKAVEYLKSKDIYAGYVNAGGDMRLFNLKTDLKIGIQHPRKNKNKLVGVLSLQDNAVVTSGDYERYFVQNGRRYHHIINPKTGYPHKNTISVTVISEKALLGDAYSTALFLLNPQKAISLANKIVNLEAFIIFEDDEQLSSICTEGFEKYVDKWETSDVKPCISNINNVN